MSLEPLNKLPDPYRRVAIAALLTITSSALLFIGWYSVTLLMPHAAHDYVSMAYFYDQNSGELFEAPADLDGPLPTPTGSYYGMPAGVRAIVFSCGCCSDPGERFIGWLEAPSRAIEASGRPLHPRPPSDIEEYAGDSLLVIRTLEDDQWHYFDSAAGNRIFKHVSRRCAEGHVLKYCEPRQRLAHEVDPALSRNGDGSSY